VVNPIQVVVSVCLEAADTLPASRRVQLYRSLAEICGCPTEASQFKALANDLEAADRRCREFAFQFHQRPAQGGAR
jgi:hypothetical protein